MIELLLQAERSLSVGLLDQAGRLYRQAADADPRNSIAVVGLARVALERGDDAEAWRQGRRALAIDPENVAARRLVDRLEEVFAERGEPLPSLPAEPVPPAVPSPAAAHAPAPAAAAPMPTPAAPTPMPAAPTPLPAAPTPMPAAPTPTPSAQSTTRAAPATPPAQRGLLDRLFRRSRP